MAPFAQNLAIIHLEVDIGLTYLRSLLYVHLEINLQEDEVAPVLTQATPKAGAKKGPEPQDAGILALGVYTLQPATAALAVGAKQTISVTFSALGAQMCLQQVGIDISDRWPRVVLATLAASRPLAAIPASKGNL